MTSEFTTTEVAKRLGIQPALLRKWKARGLLKLAPPGVSGQGRSVECYWSLAAIEEVKALQASRLKRSNMTAKDEEISALRAELEAVKAERTLAQEQLQRQFDQTVRFQGYLVEAKAELARLKDRVAGLEGQRDKAAKLLRTFLTAEYESKTYLNDCIDNHGEPYQSQWLADKIAETEAFLATLTTDNPGGDTALAVGQRVEKYTGEARWSGILVAAYQTTKGKQRYVVEVEPQGFQMIAVPGQLRAVGDTAREGGE